MDQGQVDITELIRSLRKAGYDGWLSFEDFSANDLSQLDTWVFDKVEKFFDRASTDHDLQLKLRQDKIVLVRKNRRSENYFCTKNYYEI